MIYGGLTFAYLLLMFPPYSHFSSLLLHLFLPPSSSFPPPAAKKIQPTKVTFSYAAENPDELDLQPGQVRTLPPLNPHSFHPHSLMLITALWHLSTENERELPCKFNDTDTSYRACY